MNRAREREEDEIKSILLRNCNRAFVRSFIKFKNLSSKIEEAKISRRRSSIRIIIIITATTQSVCVT